MLLEIIIFILVYPGPGRMPGIIIHPINVCEINECVNLPVLFKNNNNTLTTNKEYITSDNDSGN